MSLPADIGLRPAASPRLRDIDWRWALPRIALLFLATRLLVLVVAVAVETTQPPPPDGVAVDDRAILSSLTVWDGTYYIGIADAGYHADPDFGPDYAFYPGYPVAVKATSLLTFGDSSLAAVLAGNAAFLLALVVLFALSVRHLTPERALLSLWFLSLAPGAVAFALSYSDSLFLLLAVSAFLAMEVRRPWLAGFLFALATLTRAPGILLGLPLLLMLVERDGIRPTRAWIPLLLAPLALAIYFGYLWWLTGDPLAAVSAQSSWSPDASAAASTVGDAATGSGSTSHGNDSLALGVAPPWVMAYVAGLIRRSTPSYSSTFGIDRIPSGILARVGISASRLCSRQAALSPRRDYLAVAWPFDWVLASRGSRLGRALVLGVFATLHVALLWLAFTWRLAP